MFGKLFSRGGPAPAGGAPTPTNIGKSMKSSSAQKFSRGVDCNMKIVLRGDRNTGKSCLLRLLQGEKYTSNYEPTPEIEVANISWRYKTTDDVVKVEVWDVVDHGTRKKTAAPGLKTGRGV